MKAALTTFLSAIKGVSKRIDNDAKVIVDDCKNKIKACRDEIKRTEDKIASLEKEIGSLEKQISDMTKELSAIRKMIPELENYVSSMRSEISRLRSNIAELKQQLNRCENENERQQIKSQISSLEQRVSECERKISETEREIQNLKAKEEKLKGSITAAKTKKANLEAELQVQKNRRAKLLDKQRRLESAFRKVELDLNSCTSAAKRFETSSSDIGDRSRSAVEKSIDLIDEYLGVDFSSSMNTSSELAQLRELDEAGELDVSYSELAASPRILSGENRLKNRVTIDMPANTDKYPLEDFAFQALGQEDGLNMMSAYDFLNNFENRRDNGRDPQGNDAQHNYRQALVELLTEDNLAENPGMSPEDARSDAEYAASLMSALHNPDQAAGGSGMGVTSAGNRRVNSALGSLWRHGRAQSLYDQVRASCANMTEDEMRHTYLNVQLNVFDRNA